ncbi:MAG: hypothetical protein ACREX0_20835 [Noviherbaspirillum sp.]
MTRPEDLFEAASYDLNKFRERRMVERRATPRNSADRRVRQAGQQAPQDQHLAAPPKPQSE